MTDTGTHWVRLTLCENIPPREGRAIQVAGRELAVFNLGDRFVATENHCPHRNGPLADGIVSGQSVVCPLHGWKFSLGSGACLNHPESPNCLATFAVRIENGIILVELPCAPSEPKTAPIHSAHRDRPLRWVQRKPFVPSDEHAAEA
jgi:nitrite reductase (NADH) small subunit